MELLEEPENQCQGFFVGFNLDAASESEGSKGRGQVDVLATDSLAYLRNGRRSHT
jgi:hypothetical protein